MFSSPLSGLNYAFIARPVGSRVAPVGLQNGWRGFTPDQVTQLGQEWPMDEMRSAGPPPPRPGPEPSDHALLRQIREGSEEAATQLYVRYARRLRLLARTRSSPELARRLDPDDIVQSVFTRFFRHIREGHYDIPEGEDLWKLFLVIALNRIRSAESYHRADKRDVSATHPARGLDGASRFNGRADSARAFLRLAVAEALEHLPARHQEVIRLRLEGYGVTEIAEQTGRSRRTVERVLQESRERLGALLHDLT
jgi:RNA polymerase sigma-70 factor (ECF subfamily)